LNASKIGLQILQHDFFTKIDGADKLHWTTAFRGGDSVYGESIYTKRLELLGNYQLPYFKDKVVLKQFV